MNILIHPAQFPVQHVTYRTLDESGVVVPFGGGRVTGRERKVCGGVSSGGGDTQPIPTRYPDAMIIEFPDELPSTPEED